MDELQTVREAYGEPAPPTMREIAQARALWEGADGAAPRRSRSLFGWPFRFGVGLVAAGAAAAVAITVAGQGGGSPDPRRPSTTIDLNKQAVLAAASKAELAPTGRYWYTDGIEGQSYVVRSKTGGVYAIVGAHDESFSWHGARKGTGEAYFGRDLPARPLTAQDAAAWRQAGSPATFRVWSGDHYATYTTKATAKWRSDGPEVGSNPSGGGDFLGKTAEELRKLPTDPGKLAGMFLSDQEAAKGAGLSPKSGKGLSPDQAAYARIWRVASILSNAPVPPKVAAGLMRALAAQPGVHAIGRVADPLGRRGVALASGERAVTVGGEPGESGAPSGPASERGTYRSRDVIVFDENTGALLSVQEQLTSPGGPYAQMKPGFVINFSAVRSAKWTNTKPAPPAKLPF